MLPIDIKGKEGRTIAFLLNLPYKYATTPKTNVEFWNNKFRANQENDAKNKTILEEAGWNVITLWECELKSNFEETMQKVEQQIEINRT